MCRSNFENTFNHSENPNIGIREAKNENFEDQTPRGAFERGYVPKLTQKLTR